LHDGIAQAEQRHECRRAIGRHRLDRATGLGGGTVARKHPDSCARDDGLMQEFAP